jgi:hypothetical protein
MDIIINSWLDEEGKRQFSWYEPDNKENGGREIIQVGSLPVRELAVKDGKLLILS